MKQNKISYLCSLCLFFFLFTLSCNNKQKENDAVTPPDAMDNKVSSNIEDALKYALANAGKIDDSTQIDFKNTVNGFYTKNDYAPVWSSSGKWNSLADSLFNFIAHAEEEGLFP